MSDGQTQYNRTNMVKKAVQKISNIAKLFHKKNNIKSKFYMSTRHYYVFMYERQTVASSLDFSQYFIYKSFRLFCL